MLPVTSPLLHRSMPGSHRLHGRGFTLVELLVVIGVIAVLIAILLPTLAKARESGWRVKCAANLKQWHAAVMLYVGDHGYLPGPMYPVTLSPQKLQESSPNDTYAIYRKSKPPEEQDGSVWHKTSTSFLWRYVGRTNEVFKCPSGLEMYENASPISTGFIYYTWKPGYAYVFNNQWDTLVPFFFGYANSDGNNAKPPHNKPKKLSQVRLATDPAKFPGQKVFGAQGNSHSHIWMMADIDSWNFYQQVSPLIDQLTMWGLDRDTTPREQRRWKPVHGKGTSRGRNYVFFDGHVDFVKISTQNEHPANTMW